MFFRPHSIYQDTPNVGEEALRIEGFGDDNHGRTGSAKDSLGASFLRIIGDRGGIEEGGEEADVI